MSKIKITQAMNLPIWEWMSGDVELDAGNDRVATFVSVPSGHVLLVEGEGLGYGGGTLAEGNVDSVSFFNDDGKLTLKITGNYNAREIGDYLIDDDPWALETFLFSFNDTIVGSKAGDYIKAGAGNDRVSGLGGNDEIYGGIGKDALTGGLGSDLFVFARGDGKDTIVDFDAKGGTGKQDHVVLTGDTFDALEFHKHGEDVLVNLGGGDVLRFLDVKFKDLDETDFLRQINIEL
jgi:Ca2+-binding RTX toxin-like protein